MFKTEVNKLTKKIEVKDKVLPMLLYKKQIKEINYIIARGRAESAADVARKGITLLFKKVEKEEK